MKPTIHHYPPDQSFAGFPGCMDPVHQVADVAIIGVPFLTTFPNAPGLALSAEPGAETLAKPDSRNAARAIRRWSQQQIAGLLTHYDFDLGSEVLSGVSPVVLDCGDLALDPEDRHKLRLTTETIKALVDKGTVPVVIGGDHGTTIPVLRAFEDVGPICVVHVDAHLDWRDQVGGVRDGYSSPMRRASEMPWVSSMIQIGLRGIGSARIQEVEDAMAYGSILVTAERLHDHGPQEILRQLPEADGYYISIDIDAFDPSIAPATRWPAPGGLDYYQIIKLFRGIAGRGKVVGLDLVELVPELDVNGLTSGLAARVILSFIGILAAAGQIGSAPPG